MKIVDCAQGSDAWYAARRGIPTASQFHRIITPGSGEPSKQARKYAHELVAETLLGRPLEAALVNTFATRRGKELEPLAVQQYQFSHDVETRAVGFVTTDDGLLGCSPDRLLVGQRGGLEVKCCLDVHHMAILIDGPGDEYRPQVQGTLAICEAAYWDLYAYHPELPPAHIRTQRDEPYIAKMVKALGIFLAMRDDMLARAHASGFYAEQAAKTAAAVAA